MKNGKTQTSAARICITALFMALNIVLSSFGVQVPGGRIYLNDIAICTASILLDPFSAFAVGGIGSFLGDLFFYPVPMFVSLVTHGLQAVVISVISHYTFKKHKLFADILAVSVGAVIMVSGYTLGKIFIYSTFEYAMIKLPYEILQSFIGALFSLLLCRKFGLITVAKKYNIYY